MDIELRQLSIELVALSNFLANVDERHLILLHFEFLGDYLHDSADSGIRGDGVLFCSPNVKRAALILNCDVEKSLHLI